MLQRLIAAVLLALALGCVAPRAGPAAHVARSRAPGCATGSEAASQALTGAATLDSGAALLDRFDADAGHPRLIVLASPT